MVVLQFHLHHYDIKCPRLKALSYIQKTFRYNIQKNKQVIYTFSKFEHFTVLKKTVIIQLAYQDHIL